MARTKRNRAKIGGMDRLKKALLSNNNIDMDEIITSLETQDLENQSLRSKQEVVFNMVSDLEKRAKLPDNMAMFAGPMKAPGAIPVFLRNATAEELHKFQERFDGHYQNYYPQYLKNFPNVKKFDIIRHVMLSGGSIVDDNIIIEREPGFHKYNHSNDYKHHSWFWPQTMIYHIYTDAMHYFNYYRKTNDHNQATVYNNIYNNYPYGAIQWFIDNKQSDMITLYERYPGLFEDPQLIHIGDIKISGINPYSISSVPFMFPKIFTTSTYWKKVFDKFIIETNKKADSARSMFSGASIFEFIPSAATKYLVENISK